jgi:hypothetical protein
MLCRVTHSADTAFEFAMPPSRLHISDFGPDLVTASRIAFQASQVWTNNEREASSGCLGSGTIDA